MGNFQSPLESGRRVRKRSEKSVPEIYIRTETRLRKSRS